MSIGGGKIGIIVCGVLLPSRLVSNQNGWCCIAVGNGEMPEIIRPAKGMSPIKTSIHPEGSFSPFMVMAQKHSL